MLPSETRDGRTETEFGQRLAYLTLVWLIATVVAGVLLVVLAPWMQGFY